MSLLYRNYSGSNLTPKALSAFPKEVGTWVLDVRTNPTEKWQFSGYSWDGLKTKVSSVVNLLTKGPPQVFWFIFVLNCMQMHHLVFYSHSFLTDSFFCLHIYSYAVFGILPTNSTFRLEVWYNFRMVCGYISIYIFESIAMTISLCYFLGYSSFYKYLRTTKKHRKNNRFVNN